MVEVYYRKTKGGANVKKWKIIVSILVLMLVLGGGYLYYFLNVKEYKTADTKVQEIVQTDYKVILPGKESGNNVSPGKNAQEQQIGNEVSGTTRNNSEDNEIATKLLSSGQTSTSTSTSSIEKQNSSISVKQIDSKPTVDAILEKYQPSFEDLESQADGKVNTLLTYALNEYQAKKANSEEISYFYFYSKYTSASKTLESSTDASFNYIYNSLVDELKKSGFSTDDASPIKDHYNSLKKQRRSALMSKAMEHLN